MTGSSSVYSLQENPIKEKAKAYDSNEPEKSARHQPNIYTPLKGNNASFISTFSV